VVFKKILTYFFILSAFSACGLLSNDGDSGDEDVFSNRIPATWDVTHDWQASKWEVIEQ